MIELGHIMNGHFIGKVFHPDLIQPQLSQQRRCLVASRKTLERRVCSNPKETEEFQSSRRITRQMQYQCKRDIGRISGGAVAAQTKQFLSSQLKPYINGHCAVQHQKMTMTRS